jgi:hypothetical protein
LPSAEPDQDAWCLAQSDLDDLQELANEHLSSHGYLLYSVEVSAEVLARLLQDYARLRAKLA